VKALLMALLLAMTTETWSVRIIGGSEAVIINDLDRAITCYIYYDDGDFTKRRVKPHSESRPFSRYGFVELECF
jgi:hypothetical protein